MMEKFELPPTILNKLKCELCNEYLSYPPIMLNAVSGSVCGRCPSLEPEQNITPLREVNYEKVANSFFLFPCRYKPQGCAKTLSLQQIPNHEKECDFKPLFCPLLPLGNCPWQGTPEESHGHFATEHPDLFLESGIFELNLIENYKKNMLMPVNDNLFIIHTEYSCDDDKFYCSVYQLKYIPNKRYQYSIEFRTRDGENDYQLNSKDISIYIVDTPKEQGYSIDVSILNEHLQHPTYITCETKITENVINSSNETSLNDTLDVTDILSLDENIDEDDEEIITAEVNKMLIDIECPVCQDYMIPPIYQCHIGHSVCGVCKPQLHECPSCRGPLGQIRNFTLEKLTEHIMYQCKNRSEGCMHQAPSTNIRQHESECKYTAKHCPLQEYEECSWKGVYKAIIPHIRTEHPSSLIVDPLILDLPYSYTYDNDDIEAITIKFGQLFRLILEYVNENRKIYATVLLVGVASDAEKYMYKVEVFDFNNKQLECHSKKYCGSVNDDIHDNKHCSIWTLDMLLPLMSAQKDIRMTFKIMKAS